MKNLKLTLLLCLIFMISVSFSFSVEDDRYPDYLAEEGVEFLKAEYLLTMNSESLIADLETKFSSLFDEVHSVDAQFNEEQGYYYLVFGVKENTEKVEMLKVEPSDIVYGTYTFLDFSNIAVDEDVEYCRSGSGMFPFVCPPGCVYVYGCLGVVCGIRTHGTYCDIE